MAILLVTRNFNSDSTTSFSLVITILSFPSMGAINRQNDESFITLKVEVYILNVERYIARQPIFNQTMNVYAYELLYRGSIHAISANISDGDRATRSLLSDAMTVFGLSSLTNSKLAFVNFPESLLLSDFALLADPNEIAIEILEHTRVSALLIQKLQLLKAKGYRLALDDYTGNPDFDPILSYIDILKVDFRAVDTEKQKHIAQQFKGKNMVLLAEKVETVDDFYSASKMGYTLFQGYFFEKPTLMQKKAPALSASAYIRLFRELSKPDIDIERCAHIVHSDAVLTYSLFQKVRTLQYYRGNSIQSIKLALVFLGTDNIRRWIILLLARERNITFSDELVRSAYLRAVFTERLMEYSPFYMRSADGFLVGLFSLLDKIMGLNLDVILTEIPIAEDVCAALLGKSKNIFSKFLEFVLIYEMKNSALILPSLDLTIENHEIARLYMECIVDADKAFNT